MKITILAAAFVAAAGAACAEEAQMTVNVSDLNLSSETGARVALARIETAARSFCGDAYIADLQRGADVRACRVAMTEKAVQQANAPLVAKIHGIDPVYQVARR